MKNDLIEKIKTYLKNNDLSQCDLSYMLKIPQPTINRWLKGKSEVSPKKRRLLKQKGII